MFYANIARSYELFTSRKFNASKDNYLQSTLGSILSPPPPPPPPQCFLWPPVTNYCILLYNTLLCKKIARAPGGHKKFMLTKLVGGNRLDPNFETFHK